jgi:hypothetical protein
MHVISVKFDGDLALARVTELLELGNAPERLAELLGITRDLPDVRDGIAIASFRRLRTDLDRIRLFLEIEKHIDEVKNDKSLLRFLGDGFKEKQLSRLEEERAKFGSLIDTPRWFYQQPRVRLLSAIRDSALDGCQLGDPAWTDLPEKALTFPIAEMFETADSAFAGELIEQLERPLRKVDPRFLLEKFEGNRSILFDFTGRVAVYYSPASTRPA